MLMVTSIAWLGRGAANVGPRRASMTLNEFSNGLCLTLSSSKYLLVSLG